MFRNTLPRSLTNGAGVLVLAALIARPLAAQTDRAGALRERASYRQWLAEAPNAPGRAVAQQVLQGELTLGPDGADIPLAGLRRYRLQWQNGVARLVPPEGAGRLVPRGRPVALGDRYQFWLAGTARRMVVTIFGDSNRASAPSYYEYDPAWAFTGPLIAPSRPETQRMLTLDGIEVEATLAGHVRLLVGDSSVKLRVLRVPVPGTEETELEIYFRDATSGHGTYPAGRFVSLIPHGPGRYWLDFNRARNPFCAYNTVYPCPVPWRGNTIPAAVTAGERYGGGGLVPSTLEGP